MNLRPIILLILFGAVIPAAGQRQYPKNEFRSPVDYPITLSGAFGEIRRNHFHSGIDIRTGGVQGKPVYAIADGYVSRVNISSGGFGKALYINHPNGYTSVYAHLRNYHSAIASWIREQQYKKESFVIDSEVPEGVLKVKKGDLIAYSGNSGSSGGPHIHFEIRDTRTQEIIDPLDFGFLKTDKIPPKITWIKVYPKDDNAMVNFSNKSLLLPVTGSQGKYTLKVADTVRVSGNIIFGIETSDQAEGGLKTGVHAINLTVDGEKVFSQNIERFAFAETRYANSLLDYPAWVQSKHKIQRSYIAPNNKLGIYSDVKDRGVVYFFDSKVHKIQYTVTDAFGNIASLSFYVKSHPPANLGGKLKPDAGNGHTVFTFENDNYFERQDLKLSVPGNAVYEEFNFEYDVSPPLQGTWSGVHQLHNKFTPLHTWCSLSIKPNQLPAKLVSKALIVSVAPGNKYSSQGGTFENGWITAKIRDFGNYTVIVDTIPPVMKAVNIGSNKNVSKQSSILMKISDNLAGIKTYRGTLNGKWILMDYDAKNSLLKYSFDDRIKPGKNQFVLTVTDGVGNTKRYEATLIR